MSLSPLISPGAIEHLEFLRAFYRNPRASSRGSSFYRNLLAHRYNLLLRPDDRVLEIGCGEGDLLARLRCREAVGIDLSPEQIARGQERHPSLDLRVGTGETDLLPDGKFDVIILSDVLNYAADVEVLLRRLHTVAHLDTRIVVNIYNTLWRPVLGAVRRCGWAPRQPASSWLSRQDVINLCGLAEWEVFKTFGAILVPFQLGPLASLANRWLAPFLPAFCLSIFLVARAMPCRREAGRVSVVIPARNEAGSVVHAVERMPALGRETELIFVEGNSTDDTWDAIRKLPDTFTHGRIVKMRQTGKGKGNAVVEGFAAATGDILMILDADLTVPPEDLPKFVDVLASGRGDFANGVRLVYPMDEKAMQFANLVANKSFSLIFSWLLGQSVKDTLCGTKVLRRADYERIDRGRVYFGEFDPFGDFDLLFGADKQNMKIVDVPVRYKERFYGETNIRRWHHGVILIRMVVFAARRLKFV
ncbi:MAG: glycosyltransferase [Chthoniobacterales bacterium]|nr:glycosyltransferase [Chthoniobacterales bacterium]